VLLLNECLLLLLFISLRLSPETFGYARVHLQLDFPRVKKIERQADHSSQITVWEDEAPNNCLCDDMFSGNSGVTWVNLKDQINSLIFTSKTFRIFSSRFRDLVELDRFFALMRL